MRSTLSSPTRNGTWKGLPPSANTLEIAKKTHKLALKSIAIMVTIANEGLIICENGRRNHLLKIKYEVKVASTTSLPAARICAFDVQQHHTTVRLSRDSKEISIITVSSN